MVFKLFDVSIADHFSDGGRSDLERAKEWLEGRDILELSEKQAKARVKLSQEQDRRVNLQSSVDVAKYGNEVIAYIEDMEDQKYKVGEWGKGKIVFDWRDPEPVRF